MSDGERLIETVTLSQAQALLTCAAKKQSFLLLSPPGVGKSDMVAQAAQAAGLPCRSLLGTQIAPEDVSGVPTIVGERSVFCPPRILLPESPEPFCLFLDELPACAPDIQKAFYALLLERRIGEHPLPEGSWVVAAGNRAEDRALVRTISSALVNRVVILQVRVDLEEWLAWARGHGIRHDIISFIEHEPSALLRPIPNTPAPFSTPRAWASLSQAIDLAERAGILNDDTLAALAQGRVSAQDAGPFVTWSKLLVRSQRSVERIGLRNLAQMSVQELEISDRAIQGLIADGKNTIGEVAQMSPYDMRKCEDFDQARVDEVREALGVYGLTLEMDYNALYFNEHATSKRTLTLGQAKNLMRAMAHVQSLLLLSAPGVGKSDSVRQAAAEHAFECRSLLGTQIAPEDVSGIPRIIGERSVFCPPRVLLPEVPEPFCLFLDELPATPPDIQKAFYSLLLERRIGEHFLAEGSWVVAAGNRSEDRALVRAMSTALINRVFLINIRVDAKEWIRWAKSAKVRSEILAFVMYMPGALMREVPREPVPFSTPRAWASLSQSLDLADSAGALTTANRRALAFGTISAEDAALFCAMCEEQLADIQPIEDYFADPTRLPKSETAQWFIINRLRKLLERKELPKLSPERVNHFLSSLSNEFRFAVMIDLVEPWSELGADEAMLASLKEVTGLE